MTENPAARVRTVIALRDNDRPVHAVPEEVEHLIAIAVGLLGEVSVLAGKVDRLERQLAAATGKSLETVREEDLGAEASAEQGAARDAMIERVFQSYSGAYSAAAGADNEPPN